MRSASSSRALVAAWFDFQTLPQRDLSQALRTAVLAAEPALTEAIKWGKLVFLLDGRILFAVAPHKTHVHLQIFNGSLLPAALAPLDGSGPGLRNLRCRLHQPLDQVQVEMVVAASAGLARRQTTEARPASDDA